MASEYLKWKYRDVKPDEAAELTPREKRKNWLYYHKWHIAAVLLALAVAGDIAWNAATRVKPDYTIAYVGANPLPDETAAAVEAAFASLGEDRNGDGKIIARLSQYTSAGGSDAGAAMAAEVTLMGDVLACDSYFFLLEDPDGFQKEYHILRRLDGSLPEEGDSAGGTCLRWEECPQLSRIDLGDYSYSLMGGSASGRSADIVSKLYLARRGFWSEKTSADPEGCDALWMKLTEGAIP